MIELIEGGFRRGPSRILHSRILKSEKLAGGHALGVLSKTALKSPPWALGSWMESLEGFRLNRARYYLKKKLVILVGIVIVLAEEE